MFAGCKPGNHTTNVVTTKDTVLLFRKDSSFVIGIQPLEIKVNFAADKLPRLSDSTRLLLLFDQPRITQAPEGVYEIYLEHWPVEPDSLSASRNSFVSLLDLYSFTAPGATPQIETDITQAAKDIYKARPQPLSLCIVIRFSPVTRQDGTFSSNGGTLNFSGVRIVQISE